MSRRRTKESIIRRYIRLPDFIRRHTDKLVKNRATPEKRYHEQVDKGRLEFRKRLKNLLRG